MIFWKLCDITLYITQKTVISHIRTRGQKCDIPSQNHLYHVIYHVIYQGFITCYIACDISIFHSIYHYDMVYAMSYVVYTMGYMMWYTRMVYTMIYTNTLYINPSCYLPCYLTLRLVHSWVSWNFVFLVRPSSSTSCGAVSISAIGTICAKSQLHWVEFRLWTQLGWLQLRSASLQ